MIEADRSELDRLGNAIRVRRHTLRLSQAQAARGAGMHRNYVGALERGEVNPRTEPCCASAPAFASRSSS